MDHDDASDFPSVDTKTIDRRWISQDLQILRSGMLADAEIVCEDDATPRKVHRSILAGRSTWFKKAFFGNFQESEERRIKFTETAWRVDLILYFFYTGGIDVTDKILTSGRDLMEISVELLRLGGPLESKNMQDYGKDMLVSHLDKLLHHFCDTNTADKVKEERFNAKTDFPKCFCLAVRNAFDAQRPVKLAQDILADFAFAARIHLFKNKEFISFIKDKEVPEFGNLVLAAQMTGAVSETFLGNGTFKKWQDWQSTPVSASPPRREAVTSSPAQGSGGGLFSGSAGGSSSGGLFGSSRPM